jgi:hypothetical protein
LFAVLTAAGALCVGPVARPAAQAAPAVSTLSQLIIVDVKPEAWDDYVALQKAQTMPALQKGGIERRSAWRPQSLGRGFRVVYIYPLASLGVMDDKGPIVKALGEDGARTYNAALRKLLNATQSMAIRTRADLGYGLDGPSPTLGVVARVQTVGGRQFEFEGFLKDQWAPALKQAGVPGYFVHEVLMGGELGEYYTFTPIQNFAALDAGHPIMKSLGQAGYASLLGKMGLTIRSVEREVYKYDAELSFRPPAK